MTSLTTLSTTSGNDVAPDAISTEGHASTSSETSVRRKSETERAANTARPEPYDGGRTLYRDPIGDRAVRNIMRRSR